ncbi:hypothetical protein Tco_0756265 [Tanacetum coccineum]
MRNHLFMHGVKNDSVLGFMKFVSKYEIKQVIPKEARKRKKAHMKETFLTSNENIISKTLILLWNWLSQLAELKLKNKKQQDLFMKLMNV